MTSSLSEETVVQRGSAGKDSAVRTPQGAGQHGQLANSVFATHSVITHPSPAIKIMQHGLYAGGDDIHRSSMFGMNVVAHDHTDGMGQGGDMGLGALSLSSLDGTLSMPSQGWDMREFVLGPSPDGRSVVDSHHIPMDSSGVPLDGPVLPMDAQLPLPPHADPGKAGSELGAARTTESDEDLFAMYIFKVVHCSKQFVHDWKECPYAHEGETAR
jgi:hypothetical protein